MTASIKALMDKTAALLELHADHLDSTAQEKTAAHNEALAETLEPAIIKYEQLTGMKLAASEREALLRDANSPLIPLLAKLATSGNETAGLGGPEKVAEVLPVEIKPIGGYAPTPTVQRRGKRRDASQLRQSRFE